MSLSDSVGNFMCFSVLSFPETCWALLVSTVLIVTVQTLASPRYISLLLVEIYETENMRNLGASVSLLYLSCTSLRVAPSRTRAIFSQLQGRSVTRQNFGSGLSVLTVDIVAYVPPSQKAGSIRY